MSKVTEWVFEGNLYTVGKSLNEFPWEDNNIFPVVWYKHRLYKAVIKPEASPKISRVCLTDIYNPELKCYWTTADKVYNIIKICQK